MKSELLRKRSLVLSNAVIVQANGAIEVVQKNSTRLARTWKREGEIESEKKRLVRRCLGRGG